jgi:ribosome maturation factor RimP
VSLDDCQRLSERIGAVLDAMDVMPHAYALEVSSPGMDRVLKKTKDFEKFQGHRVKVTTREPMDGRRRFAGYLKGVEGEGIVLACGDSLVRVGLDAIEEARLDPDIHL